MTSVLSEDERRAAVLALCAQLDIDPALPHLPEALTHPSFSNEQKADPPAPDNQRLELLGDAVLGLCASELLMDRFTAADEGQLTMMRASLVNTHALAAVARAIGVDRALLLGRGADATGERNRPNVLCDGLEALVGCIYLDLGLAAARQRVFGLLAEPLATLSASGGIQRDAKSRLQELAQARGLAAPRYRVVAEKGPAHAREFWVEVGTLVDRPLVAGAAPEETAADGSPRWSVATTGHGPSKKLAEQAAAAAALAILER